jgi:4-alpha-glucanotransferase
MPLFPRSSGILLHITSLPSEFGIGDLGDFAYRFVDFLVEAGQQVWQILPLSPTIQCNSPYSSYSAFAGNQLLISPTRLVKDGFLLEEDLRVLGELPSFAQVDFAAAAAFKTKMLSIAFERFRRSEACTIIDDWEAFCTTQQWWLNDFALFAALIRHFGNDNWVTWDIGLVQRQREALSHWRKKLEREIEQEQFAQYLFFRQWQQLKEYANVRGVRLFGDMPIFVSHGSADVWANQGLFTLDDLGRRTVVAGVPPDYFSKTGQLWGNPLYRWDRLAETDYRWWVQRIRTAFQMCDLLRIDHFRGFEAYWEVDASAKTAINGRWVKGPGANLFQAIRKQLGELAIVAEDLGLITDEVHKLRDAFEFPGMRVLQFGFDSVADGFHRPENYPANSVSYTGTHDNDTIMGWYLARQKAKLKNGTRDLLDKYLSSDTQAASVHWQLINMVFNSASHTTIVPMQDVLGLGNEARMNLPGEAQGNWGWRLLADQLTDAVANNLRVITEHSGRLLLAVAR